MYTHVTILKTNDCTVHNMQLSAKNSSINKLTTMRMMGTMPKFLKYGAMIAIVHVLGISVEFFKFVCLLYVSCRVPWNAFELSVVKTKLK